MDNFIVFSDRINFYLSDMYDGRICAIRLILMYFISVADISISSNGIL